MVVRRRRGADQTMMFSRTFKSTWSVEGLNGGDGIIKAAPFLALPLLFVKMENLFPHQEPFHHIIKVGIVYCCVEIFTARSLTINDRVNGCVVGACPTILDDLSGF